MTRARIFLARLWALVRARQQDRDLDDEIRGHLEEATADYVRQGLSPDAARAAAQRSFGGVTQTHEVYRQARSFAWIEELSRDVRYAWRTLRRSPTFAVTAAATLALAIGANTAMFSVLNTVLLRPLPYRSPDQLAMLWTDDPAQNLREGRSALLDVEEWRTRSRSFADMATLDSVGTVLTGPDGAEPILAVSTSPNLFSLLGAQPVLGRTFSSDDVDQSLVLISHRLWQSRFGGSRDALGATLVLNGQPSQIVGVLPEGFEVARFDADVWKPHTARPAVRGPETWFVVGRLRPSVTLDQAQAEMGAIARRLNEQAPAAERRRGIAVVPLSLYMVGAQSRVALWMLGGAVFFVFLIAAANVTSLSLARSAARSREMGVRAALGASAGRIVRQLLTEGVVLAAVSGVIGTLLAFAGIRLIRAFGPDTLPRLKDVSLDPRVLVWALGISVLAGVLVGLAPALATVRRNLRTSSDEGGRSGSSGAAARRIRRALVVAEFALAIVLLVGAGLLVRSWLHVNQVDPGFRPERVLALDLSAPPTLDQPAQRADLYHRVLEQIQAVPGIERAGIVGDLFISNARQPVVTIERDGSAVSERLRFVGDEVSADFFTAIGTRLVRGRFITDADGPTGAPVAIVNESMARHAWPNQDAIGRRFKVGPPESDRPWQTVVGIVSDMHRQGLERDAFPQVFVPLASASAPRSVVFIVRTASADPLTLAPDIRTAVRRVEKNAALSNVAPLDQQFSTYLAQRRFQTALLTGFSLVALLMAAVGIYGLIQYSIATRTQEIGLRLAIGAQSGDIFRMVIREGLKLSLTGLALGLVGAFWLGRAATTLLFGVTSSDPWTFTAVSLLLTAVAVAACFFPARRAMGVDPITALRT